MTPKERRVAGLLAQALDSLSQLEEAEFCGPVHGARGAILSALAVLQEIHVHQTITLAPRSDVTLTIQD